MPVCGVSSHTDLLPTTTSSLVVVLSSSPRQVVPTSGTQIRKLRQLVSTTKLFTGVRTVNVL